MKYVRTEMVVQQWAAPDNGQIECGSRHSRQAWPPVMGLNGRGAFPTKREANVANAMYSSIVSRLGRGGRGSGRRRRVSSARSCGLSRAIMGFEFRQFVLELKDPQIVPEERPVDLLILFLC